MLNKTYILVFLLITELYSQYNLMYFDRGWHEPNFYTIYDTLNNYGVNIDFNDSIYWENVSNYDAIWIFEPKVFTDPPQLCITFDEIEVLKKFIKFGGNIFIGDSRNSVSADDDSLIPRPLPYNILFRLLGTSMSKKIVYPGFVPDVSCNIFFNFPPFTNDIDSIILQAPASIECGNDCYPFVFLADTFYYRDTVLFDTLYDTIIVSAISYPFIKENNCSSFVIFVSGIHDWEGREILPADNLSFAKNVLLTCIRYHGYDFSPCQVPEPYQISVISIPPCATPGDTVRIYGRNLWRGKTESLGGDIEIYIGATEPVPHEYDTIVIPIRYSQDYTGDSTWLEFIMPNLPPGTYPIRLGHKAITFDAGDIIVPCPMVAEIPECANPGDTVVVSGVNLIPDIVIQIDDTIFEPINYALGYDTIEFVCPSLPPGDYDISFFWDTLEIFSGSILIPCPTASASFPECADPGDVITISGENLVEPISITVGDSVISAVSYSEDRSKVAFRCPWLPRGRYQVSLSWHDMSVASGMIEIPCPHRCERFPNPITPNFDAINDFAQFEFDGIFVKPAQIHIFDIHGHEIRTINVPAGLSAKQHARWDGTDDGGNPVPEGVYIYTIEVAGEVVCEGTVTVAR